jgi:hypothetical protein
MAGKSVQVFKNNDNEDVRRYYESEILEKKLIYIIYPHNKDDY